MWKGGIILLGNDFKRLREKHGKSLKEAAAGVVTVATVSKFENGLVDVNMGKLERILRNIDVDLREFASLGDPKMGNPDSFVASLLKFYRSGDTDAVRRIAEYRRALYLDSHAAFDFENMMTAAGIYARMTGIVVVDAAEILQLVHSLQNVREWNENEINLFGNAMDVMPASRVYRCGRDLLAQLPQIKNWNVNLFQDGWFAVLNAVELLLRQRDASHCATFISACMDYELPLTGSVIIYRRQFLNLCYRLNTNPVAADKVALNDLLAVLQFTGASTLQRNYRQTATELLGATMLTE